MNVGFANTITIQEIAETITSGDVAVSLSTGETVKCHIEQIDGQRFMNAGELVDKEFYKIYCFDNNYTNNIVITYGTKTLRPIQMLRYSGRSCTTELKIIAVTK